MAVCAAEVVDRAGLHLRGYRCASRTLGAQRQALHGRVALSRLVRREGDALLCAPLLPGKTEAAALVEARSAREAHACRLHDLAYAVAERIAHGALGEEAAPRALLARVHVAAAARHSISVSILHGVDAAGAMHAGLGRVELGSVKCGVLVPLDLAGHLAFTCKGVTSIWTKTKFNFTKNIKNETSWTRTNLSRAVSWRYTPLYYGLSYGG